MHADNTDVPGRGRRAAGAACRPPVVGALILGGGATAPSTALALVRPRRGSLIAARALAGVAARRDRCAAIDRPPGHARGAGRRRSPPIAVVGATSWSRRSPPRRRRPTWSRACADVAGGLRRRATTRGRPRSPRRRPTGVLVGGLDLLVHQAALQFERSPGVAAPLDAMRAAGAAALGESGRERAPGRRARGLRRRRHLAALLVPCAHPGRLPEPPPDPSRRMARADRGPKARSRSRRSSCTPTSAPAWLGSARRCVVSRRGAGIGAALGGDWWLVRCWCRWCRCASRWPSSTGTPGCCPP